jgi:hypothetical protein
VIHHNLLVYLLMILTLLQPAIGLRLSIAVRMLASCTSVMVTWAATIRLILGECVVSLGNKKLFLFLRSLAFGFWELINFCFKRNKNFQQYF